MHLPSSAENCWQQIGWSTDQPPLVSVRAQMRMGNSGPRLGILCGPYRSAGQNRLHRACKGF